jgi:hypothetical protein
MRTPRDDSTLQELGGHVLWHTSQFCWLAIHLEERQGGQHITRFDDPLDGAALEAFLIHARALGAFLWSTKPRETDGVALDYFHDQTDAPPWRQEQGRPDWLSKVADYIGFGLAHVTYKRATTEAREWVWQHRIIGHEIAHRLADFVLMVDRDRVDPTWPERMTAALAPVRTFLPRGTQAVGTPMIAFYRNPPTAP